MYLTKMKYGVILMGLKEVINGARNWSIISGDALETLRLLPDECVQAVVTSPPYWGLRDYGIDGQIGLESTLDKYMAKLVEVFREVKRVLRDDGTIWLNLGDSYAPAGGDRRNHTNDPNSCIGATADAAMPRIGRVAQQQNLKLLPIKPKDLIGIPWRVAFALQADGWYLRSDIIWHKPNAMPESVADRPTKAHEYIFLLTKSRRYYYDSDAIKEDAVNGDPHAPRGSVGVIDNPLNGGRRKIKIPSGWDTDKGAHGSFHRNGRGEPKYFDRHAPIGKRNKRDVWTVSTKPFPGAHFATYPPDLIKPCILAGSPEGSIILDPFSGAGTTGLVALRYGRRYIGVEINPEYAELSVRRIIDDAPLLNDPNLYIDVL